MMKVKSAEREGFEHLSVCYWWLWIILKNL